MMNEKENKIQQYQDTFQAIVKHPIAKAILIGGTLLGVLFISGIIMKIASNTISSYKDLKEAINK